jgi:DNA-directed RNA polymerase subunit H (RpoH/RPB5)
MAVRAWRTAMEMLYDRTLYPGRGDAVTAVTALTVPGIGDNEIHRMATEAQTFAVAVIGAVESGAAAAESGVAAAAAESGAAAEIEPKRGAEEGARGSAKHVVVFHTAEQTLKKEELLGLLDGAAVIVLIISSVPSGASRKSLEAAAAAAGCRIEFFTLREMQYNVTRHECVPRHSLMTPAEEEEAMRRYRLSSRFQFHIILTSDPVARYLGLKHGNIVKIERYSPTAGTSVNYRCCRSVASGSYFAPA